jgi:hypothetical protein
MLFRCRVRADLRAGRGTRVAWNMTGNAALFALCVFVAVGRLASA